MAYIIVVICVLLTIAGMLWCLWLVKKGADEQKNEPLETEEVTKNDR